MKVQTNAKLSSTLGGEMVWWQDDQILFSVPSITVNFKNKYNAVLRWIPQK